MLAATHHHFVVQQLEGVASGGAAVVVAAAAHVNTQFIVALVVFALVRWKKPTKHWKLRSEPAALLLHSPVPLGGFGLCCSENEGKYGSHIIFPNSYC